MKLYLSVLSVAAILLASMVASSVSAPLGEQLHRANKPILVSSQGNSARFINVTRADTVFVKAPLIRSDHYDKRIAALNTSRIKSIMSSPAVGAHCRIHFPAGRYYFNGAATGWQASIQSTARNQSFTGDGINATQIIQNSTGVSATIKISHSNCTIQNLSITSADLQAAYNPDWDQHPLKTAILLEFSELSPPAWGTDPQILNVNINTTGNNMVTDGFYRPFKTGLKIHGPWLNVYAHTMFIHDVHNAIYINQGHMLAGPASFVDINAVATAINNPKIPQPWNVFFKSESNFMEAVSLINCFYMGSQFINMDGSKIAPEDDKSTRIPTTPAYLMTVTGCYVNALWQTSPSDDPMWSSIYMNLPPRPGGIQPGLGEPLYSHTLIFKDNNFTGKTPRNGAFFYTEGNVKNLELRGNEFSSGGGDRAIYVRTKTPLTDSDVAVRNITIADNTFMDFRNPITIGGSKYDPSRAVEATSSDDDPYWADGVSITGNQSSYFPVTEKGQLSAIFLNRARRVTVSGNRLPKTVGSSVIMRECEEITINGNNFAGIDDSGVVGIGLMKCRNASVSGNTIRGFGRGIRTDGSEGVAINGNSLAKCKTGLSLLKSPGLSVLGNVISDTTDGILTDLLDKGTFIGNTMNRSGAIREVGSGDGLKIESNDVAL